MRLKPKDKCPQCGSIRNIYRGLNPDDDIIPLRRRKVIEILERNLRVAGLNDKVTVRRFNSILIDLGFRLDD